MSRLFGTDGVRGVANTELTCKMAFQLGVAAVIFLGKNIVIGKDTRKSGDMLEAALAAGVMSAGGDAYLAGVIPTPAIALLTREDEADGGIVISASHNPPAYNGIKFFDRQGFKLPLVRENEIEEFLQHALTVDEIGLEDKESIPTGRDVGCIHTIDDAVERYVEHAVATVRKQGISLEGLTVAIDCGHGASSVSTPEALSRLGAMVHVINDDWNGNDINVECGSTCLLPVQELVVRTGADIGIAHDGDADRVLAVDAAGAEIDGDFIEAICAKDLLDQGKLVNNTVVSTVMSNLGFQLAMKQIGIDVIRTQVGDRHVLEAMREGNFTLGGEQSGHMIFLEHNSTGDGLVTTLQLLAAMKRADKPLAELATIMTRLPQVLINVVVGDKSKLNSSDEVFQAIELAEATLGEKGRVLVRTSGTEPLVRVMVEAEDSEQARALAGVIAAIVKEELA